jgi:hypothetical protein
MPSIMVPLDTEEFNQLRDRARDELRHPRHTARLLLREALKLPPREPCGPTPVLGPTTGSTSKEAARVSA